jgi:hypothetical protein
MQPKMPFVCSEERSTETYYVVDELSPYHNVKFL